MKKQQLNKISGGLNSLLNPTPTKEPQLEPATPATTEKIKYANVCYNIRPDLISKIKDIAYWDRKRINVVVTEAFEQYIAKWDKHGKPND